MPHIHEEGPRLGRSFDGEWIALARSGWLALFDRATQREVKRVRLDGKIVDLVFTGGRPGRLLVTELDGVDCSVVSYALPELTLLARLRLPGPGRFAAALEETLVVMCAGDERPRVVASTASSLAMVPSMLSGRIDFASEMTEQRLLVANAGRLEVWDALCRSPLYRLGVPAAGKLRYGGYRAGGRLLWLGQDGSEGVVRVFRSSDGRLQREFRFKGPLVAVDGQMATSRVVVAVNNLTTGEHTLFDLDVSYGTMEPIGPLPEMRAFCVLEEQRSTLAWVGLEDEAPRFLTLSPTVTVPTADTARRVSSTTPERETLPVSGAVLAGEAAREAAATETSASNNGPGSAAPAASSGAGDGATRWRARLGGTRSGPTDGAPRAGSDEATAGSSNASARDDLADAAGPADESPAEGQARGRGAPEQRSAATTNGADERPEPEPSGARPRSRLAEILQRRSPSASPAAARAPVAAAVRDGSPALADAARGAAPAAAGAGDGRPAAAAPPKASGLVARALAGGKPAAASASVGTSRSPSSRDGAPASSSPPVVAAVEADDGWGPDSTPGAVTEGVALEAPPAPTSAPRAAVAPPARAPRVSSPARAASPGTTWRGALADWGAAALAAGDEVSSLPPSARVALEPITARFGLESSSLRCLGLLYAAWLNGRGRSGLPAAELAGAAGDDEGWTEALGNGPLARTGLARARFGRLRLSPSAGRFLDGAAPAVTLLHATHDSVAGSPPSPPFVPSLLRVDGELDAEAIVRRLRRDTALVDLRAVAAHARARRIVEAGLEARLHDAMLVIVPPAPSPSVDGDARWLAALDGPSLIACAGPCPPSLSHLPTWEAR